MTDWRVYLRQLLALKPSLHCISYEGRTPFSSLIRGSLLFGSSKREDLRVALLLWLEDLHDSGIDLEEYGRKELELYEMGLTDSSFECRRYEGDENVRTWCIARFVYGPLPSDWDVVLEEQERVPGKPARVPGAWIDDADDDDDDNDDEGDEDDEDDDDEGDEDDEGDDDEGDEGEDKGGRKEPEIEAS